MSVRVSKRAIDVALIHFFRNISVPVSRFALFTIFFWFGFLKVLGLSPASGVVERLFNETIPFMNFGTFLILFGLLECLIGILFLIKGAERIVIPLLFLHMITTFGPLFFLSQETWSGFMVPTLEGQYIIKNLVIIATAVGIAAHLHPLKKG
jgi:uncharacterized membrane protein YkgB